jgi:hypothetical protein
MTYSHLVYSGTGMVPVYRMMSVYTSVCCRCIIRRRCSISSSIYDGAVVALRRNTCNCNIMAGIGGASAV